MGVTGYGGGSDYPGSPSSRRARPGRPQWVTGGILVASFVALLYVVEGIDSVTGHRLDENGIRPLETDGLDGVLFAPLLHANWGHLVANTVPALVLGFLAAAAGVGRFLLATAIIWLLGGVGTWLIGNIGSPYETNHIGASGLIFGWLTYVIVRGFFNRSVGQILIGVVVLVLYGGVLWGVLPGQFGVSWQGHLSGAVAGVLAAYWLSGRERKVQAARGPGVPPGLTP
ncbi:peptidase, S54 family [Mycobacteroides abscessus subsp. massiliense]|uniref:rhomboid family intramembrane serine protease n=1 Tax=Mycobacteroides abscessus TaxID=36809 RepID=UPI0009C992CD|nr:rhomboid family intramembrane serine protease [Mycobacteroides abscessus]SKF89503.1 peptidase, S54 family [Mycobacteroides abscessus subsp. massiliense]SKH17280.1 peptidase, S54 family [Mycobacteroides abscessus subsp. massiliense]SKJ35634.1 peptidase, S54 family [Mycobacteroides abscessus subsp. massiliense]SKJ72569.1 peptidase, S54 family [Mycobacteroides abscessus subsp. massiliense]SKL02030.1 peptidase, S54 family [Mycobacteroides abscessus subsp. massiliense]